MDCTEPPGATLETGSPDRGAAIMTGRWLAVVPLFLSLQIVGPGAAQDVEFDLTIDFDALHYESPDPMADNPPEGLVTRWDRHPRVDWSRPAGKSWETGPGLAPPPPGWAPRPAWGRFEQQDAWRRTAPAVLRARAEPVVRAGKQTR